MDGTENYHAEWSQERDSDRMISNNCDINEYSHGITHDPKQEYLSTSLHN